MPASLEDERSTADQRHHRKAGLKHGYFHRSSNELFARLQDGSPCCFWRSQERHKMHTPSSRRPTAIVAPIASRETCSTMCHCARASSVRKVTTDAHRINTAGKTTPMGTPTAPAPQGTLPRLGPLSHRHNRQMSGTRAAINSARWATHATRAFRWGKRRAVWCSRA